MSRDVVVSTVVHLGITPHVRVRFHAEADGTISMYVGTANSMYMRREQAQAMFDALAEVLTPALDPGGREGEFIVPCQGEPLPVGAATTGFEIEDLCDADD